jgi:hypothetical protein
LSSQGNTCLPSAQINAVNAIQGANPRVFFGEIVNGKRANNDVD